MKHILISVVVAALVCGVAFWLDEQFDDDADEVFAVATPSAAMPAVSAPALSLADALVEDVWVNGARQPGSDRRTLSSASDSVCYLTKVELSGIQGPEDKSACSIEIDDFTGFWQLVATAEEGSRSEIRCNARCFSLASEGESP